MHLNEVNKIVQGQQYGDDVLIRGFAIDTRNLNPGDLYIAIKGERFDGNDFVDQARDSGAVAAIVQKRVKTTLPYIQVENTRIALAELAAAKRRQSGLPLIAITGSNGKTTVKEMTAAILGIKSKVLYTRGNFNNDIGMPLTLLGLDDEHEYAVIEMGANHPGEIRYLVQYAQPDISVINNVGPAHIEGFGDLAGVSRAKGEIIEGLGVRGIAVLNRDDPFFSYWQGLAGTRKIISFGVHEKADVRAEKISQKILDKQFLTKFNIVFASESESVSLPLAGTHNILNALAASAACLAAGVDLQQIRQGLAQVKPVQGRLQPRTGIQGNIIIDDSYNANPASLEVALDVLLNCDGEPWVALGAFGELGHESRKIHRQMGTLIRSKKVQQLFATGPDTRETVNAFGQGGHYFETREDLIDSLEKKFTHRQVLLIKGSRAQHMEEVVKAFTDKVGV